VLFGGEGRVEIGSEWTARKHERPAGKLCPAVEPAPLKPKPGLSGPPVIFQDVVHSNGTREADCDEQSSFRGAIEWTFTRMPD
jgi:hypothetical protein